MKKISLSFLLILLSLFLGSFSCEDHGVPAPQIVTLPVTVLPQPARVSADVGRVVQFALKFPSLGNSVVEEYGIVYSSLVPDQEAPIDNPPRIDGFSVNKRIFDPTVPVVNVTYTGNQSLPFFDTLYYRAYAKISGGGVIYGETLTHIIPFQ